MVFRCERAVLSSTTSPSFHREDTPIALLGSSVRPRRYLLRLIATRPLIGSYLLDLYPETFDDYLQKSTIGSAQQTVSAHSYLTATFGSAGPLYEKWA